MLHRLGFALLVVAAACGGKPKTGSVEHVDTMAHAEHQHGGGEGDHPTMPPALHEFHAHLSPLWHMPTGPDRATATCGEVEAMEQMLGQVEAAGAPADVDAAAWTARVGELRARWVALTEDCMQHDAENFDATFAPAHDAFHALIALLPMADK